MKIVSIHHAQHPLRSEIRNAWIDFSEMTASTVAVVSDVVRDGRPLVGYGFCSNGRYAQGGIIEGRLIPRLMAAPAHALLNEEGTNVDPHRCWDVMMRNEKPGGHGERSVAVGTLDMALWDLAAKVADVPLHAYLSKHYPDLAASPDLGATSDLAASSTPAPSADAPSPRVYTYAAGGYYYPGKGIDALTDEIRRYLDMGFESVKMKIGGASLADDMRRIEAVARVVGDPSRVAVDANGRFDLATALAYNHALEQIGPKWYEEAGDPLDYRLQAMLGEVSTLPMATGENLFSLIDTRNLVRYAGLNPERDYIQVDPVLSYGVVEYLRILRMLRTCGWSAGRCIPHGGHQLTLHIAAAFGLYGNEAYPEVFQPFSGFHDGAAIEQGFVTLPDAPGIGFELKDSLRTLFQSLHT